MNDFGWSKKSVSRFDGVDVDLIIVADTTLITSDFDLKVPYLGGKRNIHEQKSLVESGQSQTIDSDHLYGKAVDLLPIINGRPSYHWPVYFELAYKAAKAAARHNIELFWGGIWNRIDNVEDIEELYELQEIYVQNKRSRDEKPFIDGAHFYKRR